MSERQFMAYLRQQAEAIDAWLNEFMVPELFRELKDGAV